jgi:E3 ubiquitin-protein ligase HERC1
MRPTLNLFIPSPDMRRNQGEALLVPDPEPVVSGSLREKMYFYAGVLLAVGYISKLLVPFKFARFIWNSLTGRAVSISEIYAIDREFAREMAAIEECEANGIDAENFSELFTNTFQVANSAGEIVPLFVGGQTVKVTFHRRLEFVQLAQKFRIREFTSQLDALGRGFHTLFDASVARLLSPWELELLICGAPVIDLDELKKNCQIEASDHAQMLWRVLASFTNEERMSFIKFGCGRVSLPPPGTIWTQKLKIDFAKDSRPDRSKPLPTAATCNAHILIPKYTSDDVMAEKIRTALRMGADIEQDHPTNLMDLSHFT